MKTAHRISFLGLFIFTPLFLLLKGSVSAEGGEDVTFTQQVNEGDLTLNYEETNIDFGIVTATGDVQDKNATLGGEDTNENNIEVRSGVEDGWELQLGVGADEWEDEAVDNDYTYDFIDGKLSISQGEVESNLEDPNVVFSNGSIELAKYTGMSTGDWDLYGIDLEQEIPGDVAIGSYTLPMTLTLFQSPS